MKKEILIYALLAVLVVVAIAMIYIGITKEMLPPMLTGVGFAIIGILFFLTGKK
ncbi:MAG: hypothetical protein Q4G08_05235 [Capnocytophaga sp.]|nr:hypothetical protein [Capnocytophaga sp.]